jgi:hypothetical protein
LTWENKSIRPIVKIDPSFAELKPWIVSVGIQRAAYRLWRVSGLAEYQSTLDRFDQRNKSNTKIMVAVDILKVLPIVNWIIGNRHGIQTKTKSFKSKNFYILSYIFRPLAYPRTSLLNPRALIHLYRPIGQMHFFTKSDG